MAPAVPARPATPVLTHSHNDYNQRHPLADALSSGFRSVEADIWLVDGEIWVSHLGLNFVGTLRELYLEPLRKMIERLGSVYGDGEPFYLWLDIKTSEPELRPALQALLGRYPMLARFDGRAPIHAPVIAILTGDEGSKTAYVKERAMLLACRDSSHFQPSDAPGDPAWLWYSLRWRDYFEWDGSGEIPLRERDGLRSLIAAVHARGRALRFWETPDSERLWAELIDAGVDMIGTDDLPRLHRFLENTAAGPPAPALARAPLPSSPER